MKIFILIERVLDVFFLSIISPPGYKPPDYRPTQKPLRNCVSPGLITGILRYVVGVVAWGAKGTNELLQNVSHEALRPGFDISKVHDIYSYFNFCISCLLLILSVIN